MEDMYENDPELLYESKRQGFVGMRGKKALSGFSLILYYMLILTYHSVPRLVLTLSISNKEEIPFGRNFEGQIPSGHTVRFF